MLKAGPSNTNPRMQILNKAPQLKRTLSLPMVTFFGLGNILGAGIYVLIGKVAGHAGMHTPFAFLLASTLAIFTAFSFSELASRYPLSAGEAVYIQKGFGLRHLSLLTGLIIILSGIVSAATITQGFVGYTQIFIDIPRNILIISLLSVLGIIAAWGISESVKAVAYITILEIIGLLVIIGAAGGNLAFIPERLPELIPSASTTVFNGIFAGSFIAFYAFIGFEDMVNVAEETVNPEKNMPYAILLCMLIATFLYFIVALISVLSVSPETLSLSEAPLATIYEQTTGNKPFIIALISIIAVVNGALIQIVMASRVCYGLSQQGWIPKVFGEVNKKTQTPLVATTIITLTILIMAISFSIETLARVTSFLLLIIFSLVNLSLIRIKLKSPLIDNIFLVPMWIPTTGFLACLFFLFNQLRNELL